MANTTSRTLALLSLLQNHRHWPGAELAQRLEVSERTLRRDIDRLRELGYPVDAQRGVDGGYQLAAGAVLPPLVLDDEEAVALGVGLHAAVQGDTVAGIAEAAVRALAKVVQVMPSRLRRRVDALAAMTVPAVWGGTGPSVDPGVLTAIAQACRDTERLEFTYTARDGAHSERHVEPHRLVLLEHRWYLVAWDLSRYDWRSFRLDRLAQPHCSGAHFWPRELPTRDAAAFVRAGIGNIGAQHRVEALIHAPASAIRARIGWWGTIEDVDEGRCLLRMTSDTLSWPTMVLGATGAEFEVVSPPELLDDVRDWADRFSRARTVGQALQVDSADR
jgi:predicted DNA-binding transcriptional regulator YafY